MRFRHNYLLSIVLSCLITAQFFSFIMPSVKSATNISVTNPSTGSSQFIFYTNSTSVDARFNLTVWVDTASDVASWQVGLVYNATLLNASRVWIPSSDPSYIFYGKGTFAPPPSYQLGRITVGDLTIPVAGTSFSTPKRLVTIELAILSAPPSGSKVSSILSIDNGDTYLLDSNTNEIVCNKIGGNYEYISSEGPPPPPPPPSNATTITVLNPATGNNQFIFNTSSMHVGDRFNATLQVNKATDVASWQVRLTYNLGYLNATRAWIQSTDPDYIFYGLSTFTPPVSFQPGFVQVGDLTIPVTGVTFTTPKKLAIIEFSIIDVPTPGMNIISYLSIDNMDTYLLNTSQDEIPTVKVNGYYELTTEVLPVGTRVDVVPQQLTVGSPGVTLPTPPFSLDITVSNIVDLYAWQVKVYFDSSILGFVSAVVPQGNVFEGRQFYAPPPVVEKDSYGFYVMAGATLMGNQTGYTGNGILCQLTFTGVNPGNSPITFSRPLNDKTYLLNTKLDNIPFSATDGNVTVLGKVGPPKTPSNITLTAYPTTVIVGDGVNLNGEIIPSRPFRDLSIFIRQVNGSWMLLNMVQTDYNSQYSYVWITQSWQVGWFELKASWTGDDTTYGAESPAVLVDVEPRQQHDLAVGLQIPDYSLPRTPTTLKATVYNVGLSTEGNVEFMILVDGVTVSSVTIPSLTTSHTYTLTCQWTPQSEGTYNITAYAPPVAGETNLFNNKMWKFITVTKPLIQPLEGQWARYNVSTYDPYRSIWTTITWELTYAKYVSPYQINVTLTARDPVSGQMNQGWMILNIITRRVEMDSGVYWAGLAYPGWIQTNITIGSAIELLMGNATVAGSQIIKAAGYTIDCWKLTLSIPYIYNETLDYTFWYDKTTGLWIAMEFEVPVEPVFKSSVILVATNIPVGPVLKIETDKPMYERGEIANLTITYEYLDVPVADATVLIEVNYPNGTLWFSWTTTTDANGTASMSFLIPSGILNAAPYGTYTIYATAYKIGMQPAQGIATFMVVHYEPDVKVWFEAPDVALVNQNVTIILHVANTGNGTAYDVTVSITLPSNGDLEVLFASGSYAGTIDPGKEVTLTAVVRGSKPYRYSFSGLAEYTKAGSILKTKVQASKTIIFAYHPDYPVDLLDMTVSVSLQEVTITFTVINYGYSPIEITLITSIQHTATKLMIGSMFLKVTIPQGAKITISLTMTIPPEAPTGDYSVQGILATDLPHEGGFPLVVKEQTITL